MVNSLGEKRLDIMNEVIHPDDLTTPGHYGAYTIKEKHYLTSPAGITTLKSIRKKKSSPEMF